MAREYLRAHPNIKYVFIDFPCLPQGERNAKDKIDFFTQLPNMYLLYLGTSVLVCVVNREYMERFWTQLEAWYSFRKGTEQGLVSTPKEQLRCTIVCVHEEDAMFEDDVVNRWANCSTEHACEILAKPWVRVYDQSDKVLQLLTLHHLEFHVIRLCVKKLAASNAVQGEPSILSAPFPDAPPVPRRLSLEVGQEVSSGGGVEVDPPQEIPADSDDDAPAPPAQHPEGGLEAAARAMQAAARAMQAEAAASRAAARAMQEEARALQTVARAMQPPAASPVQPPAPAAPRMFADLASLLAAADVPLHRAELFEKEGYGVQEVYAALRMGNEDSLRNDLRGMGLTMGEFRRLIAALMP